MQNTILIFNIFRTTETKGNQFSESKLISSSTRPTLMHDADRAPAGPAFVNPRAYASAACDGDGTIVIADPAFAAWAAPLNRGRAELGALRAGRASVSYLLEDKGKFIAVAAAPLAAARHWPLAAEVRRALERGQAEYALVAHLPPTLQPRGLATAARLFRARME